MMISFIEDRVLLSDLLAKYMLPFRKPLHLQNRFDRL